jgi:DNA-binding NarL/FixJ family response regulator
MCATKILVVDDQVLFSELLSRTLSTDAEFTVVGIAHDGEAAVRLAGETQPDVVLMDIELPGKLDGIEAAQLIQQTRPETGIVLLSAHNDRRYLTRLPLNESPSWSYLLKQSVPDLASLIRAIEGSMRGLVVLDPEVVRRLRPREGSPITKLTPRQQEVLALIAQGFTNAAIAQRLVLTEKSVETYIGAIYQQLQLTGEGEIHARVKATLIYLAESRSAS